MAEQCLSPQQEAFAAALASGMNQSDAYRSAFPACLKWLPKTVHEEASKLAALPKLNTRLAELRRPAVEAVEMSAKAHVARLFRISEAAFLAGDYGPAARAEIAIGQVAGHYVQKVEVKNDSFAGFSALQKVELVEALSKEVAHRRLLANAEIEDVEVKGD